MSKKKKKQQQNKELLIIWSLVCVCVLTIFLIIKGTISDNKNDNYICSSCHKTFTNRADTKSIAYTSMCEPCYEDYKFKQELQEEIQKYQERN